MASIYKTFLWSRFVFLGVVLWLLASCAAQPSSWLGPAGDAVVYAVRPLPAPLIAPLPKGVEALQVAVGGRQTLMVLGQRRPAPGDAIQDEFWYSAQAELLHLQDGRLWRAVGMTTEWREQRSHAPAWADVPADGQAVVWRRKVNRMPGYRWEEEDRVSTRRLLQAPADKATQWPQAQWFVDEVLTHNAAGGRWQHAQRFAVLQGQVVYSEQCIAPDLCLMLTRIAPQK